MTVLPVLTMFAGMWLAYLITTRSKFMTIYRKLILIEKDITTAIKAIEEEDNYPLISGEKARLWAALRGVQSIRETLMGNLKEHNDAKEG